MKRFAKRILSRVAPAGLRSWARRRARARWADDVPGTGRAWLDADAAACEFGEGRCFRMPKEYLGDLQYFTSHADVRGEFFGIAAHAALADRGVLFDIGAHAGTISLLFCAAAPGNRAYAFEPSPLLLGRLDASARLNGFGDRLSIQPIAIGERNGSLSVLMDPVGGFVQSQRFAHSMWGEPERREVPMETLEAAAERLGVHPTHVKVDIEGYEHEVVSGSRDYLRRRKPTLFFELHLNYLEERGLDPGAVVGMLSDAGYRFESYGGRARTAAELADCPLASVRFVARAR